MAIRKNGILFPPEASVNWILNSQYLINILCCYDFAIIDRGDYYRYLRLARESNLSFTRAYLLQILYLSGFLKIIDYTAYYNLHKCKQTLNDADVFVDSLFRFDCRQDVAYEYANIGYAEYINYARSEVVENVYRRLDGEKISDFFESQYAAVSQKESIAKKSFCEEKLSGYLNRLFTKTISAYHVACELNKNKAHNVRIFDSKEYALVQELTHLIKFPGYDNLYKLSAINDSNQFSAEKFNDLCDFFEEDALFSILAMLSTIVKHKDSVNFLRKQIETVDVNKIKEDATKLIQKVHNSKEVITHKNICSKFSKQMIGSLPVNALGNLTGGIVGYAVGGGIPGVVTGFFAGHIVGEATNFVSNLVGKMKKAKNVISSSSDLEIVKLIAAAAISNEVIHPNHTFPMLYTNFSNLLKGKAHNDIVWTQSQRIMGNWTQKNLYVPWYENLSSERFTNHSYSLI